VATIESLGEIIGDREGVEFLLSLDELEEHTESDVAKNGGDDGRDEQRDENSAISGRLAVKEEIQSKCDQEGNKN